MKTILFALLFLFVPKICISQLSANDKMVYLDSSWVETSQDHHKYYRIIKDYYSNKDLYEIKEYYKSGAIRTEGFSKNKDNFAKEGELTLYFENGNKYKVCHYLNKKLIGKEFEWYENGNKKREIEYTISPKKEESKIKIIQYWNQNNNQMVIDGTGDYEETSKEFYSKGKLKSGFKEGLWEGYDNKIGYTFSENYENQKLVSGISIDSEKITHNYTIVDKKPEDENGIIDFYNFFSKNFKLPNLAEGVHGKFYIKFIVDKDGTIIEPKILKSIGSDIDKEALRVLFKYKKFTPREIRGIKTNYTYSIPISVQSAESINTKKTPSPSEMIKNTNPRW
jgi:antitoxin component YwqK of YwqJK toxin-antitoxin module